MDENPNLVNYIIARPLLIIQNSMLGRWNRTYVHVFVFVKVQGNKKATQARKSFDLWIRLEHVVDNTSVLQLVVRQTHYTTARTAIKQCIIVSQLCCFSVKLTKAYIWFIDVLLHVLLCFAAVCDYLSGIVLRLSLSYESYRKVLCKVLQCNISCCTTTGSLV